MTWTVTKGDCLKVMRSLPENSIDACITDPPYGTTACKWDSVIPFEPMWAELKRIVKPNGAIVLFASQPFTSALVMSNLQMFKYEWIWKKGRTTGFVHAKNKPLKAHENVLVFSSGTTVHKSQSDSRMTYNPQFSVGTPYRKRQTSTNVGLLKHAPSKSNFDFVGSVCENSGFRYPTSVREYSQHNVGLFHPTQKPVDLLRYLVRTYTNEGETVLDFTCGSGTTGVACVLESRNFIGIEREKNYAAIARKRIAEASRMEVAA